MYMCVYVCVWMHFVGLYILSYLISIMRAIDFVVGWKGLLVRIL